MGVDIVGHPRLRDRRIAASDVARSTKGGWIYGAETRARTLSEQNVTSFNNRGLESRQPGRISTVILHVTAGPELSGGDAPPHTDSNQSSDDRIDAINAHFVVTNDGTVFYTRDILFILNNVGAGRGVDIEFAGCYGLKLKARPDPRNPYTPSASPTDAVHRLNEAAVRSGRTLVKTLRRAVPSIRFIHPHGQVQRSGGKYDTCCGPDIWMNVGEWCATHLSMTTDITDRYRNKGISPQQRNAAGRQPYP